MALVSMEEREPPLRDQFDKNRVFSQTIGCTPNSINWVSVGGGGSGQQKQSSVKLSLLFHARQQEMHWRTQTLTTDTSAQRLVNV